MLCPSAGTFAVISIACRDALKSFEFDTIVANVTANPLLDSNATASDSPLIQPQLKPIDVLVALALLVGIIQVN